MKKLIAFSLAIGLILPPIFPIHSEELGNVQSALDYLKSQPADAWTIMAQTSAGETNLDLDFLKTVNGNLSTDYEKAILALAAAGKNPRTFGNIDFAEKLKSFYQAEQIGSPDLLNDDFWGILALIAAGESAAIPIIQDSKNFILSNQNQDGGWGYASGTQSDTNDTAIAIMALLETGANGSDSAIVNAVNYLKNSQNSDGGFPYSSASDSDSGSDAWVISAIYKLGQNPYDWQKEGKNPIDHLKSLQRADGSFKWIASQDQGYPTLTAYAVIALTQNYYPVGRLHQLRIEGEDNQICDDFIGAKNALEIVKNGAEVCGYTYFIENSDWDPYLKKINQDEAQGLQGWLYFVNFQSPEVGAADYNLKPGDGVLWYFGEWGWKPARLTLASQKADLGNNLEAKVEYLENSEWKPLGGASIYAAGQTFITDGEGQADLNINKAGLHTVWAEKSGYVRTEQAFLSVGEGVSKNIDLNVEIVPPETVQIAFSVSKQQIDFGRLSPGSQSSDQILIKNDGINQISIEASVSGNQIFAENLKIDNFIWQDFEMNLNSGSNANVSVGLIVPSNWTSFGSKTGDLTFWARAGN